MKCSVDGCDRGILRSGLCNAHFLRKKRTGNAIGIRPLVGEKGKWLESHSSVSTDDCVFYPYQGGKVKIFSADIYDYPARAMCKLVYGNNEYEKPVVRHLCGNGHLLCVNPKHLKWGSNSENQLDRIKHGTSNRGSSNGKSKLKEEDVIFIKKEIEDCLSPEKIKALSERFAISRATIYDIFKRRRWSWL